MLTLPLQVILQLIGIQRVPGDIFAGLPAPEQTGADLAQDIHAAHHRPEVARRSQDNLTISPRAGQRNLLVRILQSSFPLLPLILKVVLSPDKSLGADHIVVIKPSRDPASECLVNSQLEAPDVLVVVVLNRTVIHAAVITFIIYIAGLITHVLVITAKSRPENTGDIEVYAQLIGHRPGQLRVWIADKPNPVAFLAPENAVHILGRGHRVEMTVIEVQFGRLGNRMGYPQARADLQLTLSRLLGRIIPEGVLILRTVIIGIWLFNIKPTGVGLIVVQPEPEIGNHPFKLELVLDVSPHAVGRFLPPGLPVLPRGFVPFMPEQRIKVIVNKFNTGFDLVVLVDLAGQIDFDIDGIYLAGILRPAAGGAVEHAISQHFQRRYGLVHAVGLFRKPPAANRFDEIVTSIIGTGFQLNLVYGGRFIRIEVAAVIIHNTDV
ncbi:hypothetical protein ES703_08245 [subsurface metagenome]